MHPTKSTDIQADIPMKQRHLDKQRTIFEMLQRTSKNEFRQFWSLNNEGPKTKLEVLNIALPYKLSDANHSANEVSVSCNFSAKSFIDAGNRLLIFLAKSMTMFSDVG